MGLPALPCRVYNLISRGKAGCRPPLWRAEAATHGPALSPFLPALGETRPPCVPRSACPFHNSSLAIPPSTCVGTTAARQRKLCTHTCKTRYLCFGTRTHGSRWARTHRLWQGARRSSAGHLARHKASLPVSPRQGLTTATEERCVSGPGSEPLHKLGCVGPQGWVHLGA